MDIHTAHYFPKYLLCDLLRSAVDVTVTDLPPMKHTQSVCKNHVMSVSKREGRRAAIIVVEDILEGDKGFFQPILHV